MCIIIRDYMGTKAQRGRVTLLFSLWGLRERSREKRKRKEVDIRQAGGGERSRRGHWGILEPLLRLGRCFPWPPSLPLRGHVTSQERCPRVEGRGGKLPSSRASLPGAPAQACQTPGSLRHSGVPRHCLSGGKLSVEVTKLEPIRTRDNEASQHSPSLHPSHY